MMFRVRIQVLDENGDETLAWEENFDSQTLAEEVADEAAKAFELPMVESNV